MQEIKVQMNWPKPSPPVDQSTVESHEPKSWRDLLPVHPGADVLPIMPEDELRELGEDIRKNGLDEPITLCRLPDEPDRIWIADGRNRLAAIELVGLEMDPEWPHKGFPAVRWIQYDVVEAFIITKNFRRRNLTKEQQADLIVKVMKASTDFANLAESVKRGSGSQVQGKDDLAKLARSFSPQSGKRGGSTKDALKEKIVDEARKHGLSTRTIERAIAKDRGPTQTRRESKPTSANATIQKQGISRVIPEPQKYQAQNLVPHEITPAVTTIPEKSSAAVEKPIPSPVPNIEPAAESAENDPAFKGLNSYEIKFTVDGSRLSQVKKRILQLFPNWGDDIEVISLNGKAPSRADRLEGAKGTVEEILGEIQSWRENLPENLQTGEKADQLDECIQQLETAVDDLDAIEFPPAFGG